MVTDTLREVDDAVVYPTKMPQVDGESFSSVRDVASKLEVYHIHSIESTVVIRQLPSLGISFQLWQPATTLVKLLDNYRREPINSPLSNLLSSNGLDSPPLNIIELGSGTGIVGIVAAATLGANVTVTDLPQAIENLQFNVDANAETVAKFGGKVNVAPLRWGETDDLENLGEKIDLIIASDVVYHEHLFEPLLKTLRLMLLEEDRNSKKVFLMAHLRRWKKDSIFFKKARKFFAVDIIHCDDPQEGSRIGVTVYRFAHRHSVISSQNHVCRIADN